MGEMFAIPGLLTETEEDIANRSKLRETPLGEYLGAKVRTGADQTLLATGLEAVALDVAERGSLGEFQPIFFGEEPDLPKAISKEEYQSSEWFRDKVPWFEGMTEVRAKTYAENFDTREYRDSLIERSPFGLRSGLGFGATVLGSLIDPVNYIPFLGAANRARLAGSLGVVGGRAATGAIEATIGTAVTDPIIMHSLQGEGYDFGWEDMALDILVGGVAGGLLGTGGGLLEKRKMATDLARRRITMVEREKLGRALEATVSADGEANVKGILDDDTVEIIGAKMTPPEEAARAIPEQEKVDRWRVADSPKPAEAPKPENIADTMAIHPDEDEFIHALDDARVLDAHESSDLRWADKEVEAAQKYETGLFTAITCI